MKASKQVRANNTSGACRLSVEYTVPSRDPRPPPQSCMCARCGSPRRDCTRLSTLGARSDGGTSRRVVRTSRRHCGRSLARSLEGARAWVPARAVSAPHRVGVRCASWTVHVAASTQNRKRSHPKEADRTPPLDVRLLRHSQSLSQSRHSLALPAIRPTGTATTGAVFRCDGAHLPTRAWLTHAPAPESPREHAISSSTGSTEARRVPSPARRPTGADARAERKAPWSTTRGRRVCCCSRLMWSLVSPCAATARRRLLRW